MPFLRRSLGALGRETKRDLLTLREAQFLVFEARWYCFPESLAPPAFPPAVDKGPFPPRPHGHWWRLPFVTWASLTGVKRFPVVLMCMSLLRKDRIFPRTWSPAPFRENVFSSPVSVFWMGLFLLLQGFYQS